MTLIERLRVYAGEGAQTDAARITQREAADAIQALQAENERIKADFDLVADSCVAAQAKCDALAAKLATLEADERQPLSVVLVAVRDYLPPNGITAQECLNRIISAVDPWPLPCKPLIALKDVEISLMAHNEDEGDWNALRFRDCWHKGYMAGARAIEAAHGIQDKGGQQ
jgi:hypothetical protein